MLGRELVKACRRLAARQPIECCELDQEEIDIADPGRVCDVVGQLRPRLLINAAGYTDVDGCESHPELAQAVNADGPANLARACRANRCRLVHVSSDYVFDGRKSEPYLPHDPVNPLSVYGRTKADGERLVRDILPDHVIVRSSWLFGYHGRNFVKAILKTAGGSDQVLVVTDQVGCPTYAGDLAEALVVLGRSNRRGTYHFCNAGSCSWNEFAAEIVRQAGVGIRVLPTTTAELNRPAVRPAYSILGTEGFVRHTGIVPRPWPEALARCLEELGQVNGIQREAD